MLDLAVVGGGAAGFFAAACAADALAARGVDPRGRIAILERGRDTLAKVRVSGGGRCNVTHAAFDPRELVRHYPRGRRELRGPFSRFAPGDTMAWFEARGVALKTEDDGRVFPVSDDSSSIVDCLRDAVQRHGIPVHTGGSLRALAWDDEAWTLGLAGGEGLTAKRVALTTGSNPRVWDLLRELGLPVVPPVPSLFTFRVPHPPLHDLKGVSVPDAGIELSAGGRAVATRGPLLVTHWGLSGPTVLRASAEAARELAAVRYETRFRVSWTGHTDTEVHEYLSRLRREAGGQTLAFDLGLPLPRRLWRYLVERAGLDSRYRWADLRANQLTALARTIAADAYEMRGKTTFKEEFVTAGGLDLSAVDFRTFAVRAQPNLYAAGEVLDVDAVTGGFNFQAAWTGGWHVGEAVAADIARHAEDAQSG